MHELIKCNVSCLYKSVWAFSDILLQTFWSNFYHLEHFYFSPENNPTCAFQVRAVLNPIQTRIPNVSLGSSSLCAFSLLGLQVMQIHCWIQGNVEFVLFLNDFHCTLSCWNILGQCSIFNGLQNGKQVYWMLWFKLTGQTFELLVFSSEVTGLTIIV